MNFRTKGFFMAGALAAATFAAATAQAAAPVVVFDNISPYMNATPGAAVSGTTSTPNTFMGTALTLAAGTTSITGFDLFPVNLSGTAYTGLKINVFVWGNVNTGAVNAANPAFGNLLGSYSFTTGAGSFSTGSFFPLEGAELTTPLALTSTTIGLSFNIQGTTNGTTYASVNGLNSLIVHSAAPTVGSSLANGYYRNGSGETNGNFTSGVRSLTGLTNQSLAVRIYGDNVSAVPEPGTYLMLGLGLAVLAVARRRRQAD